MKIVATSDLHGTLPRIPKCDLLIIAGDVCPIWDERLDYQLDWLSSQFREWLGYVPAKHIVGIAGNHDHVFEQRPTALGKLKLPWTYLRDDAVTIEDIKLYGLPWVPDLPGWAFYASDDDLERRYGAVPKDTGIVISHGPPRGYLDNIERRFGSKRVNQMLDRVQPELFICGHVHEGYGYKKYYSGTQIYNVAHNDIVYLPSQLPVTIDFR